MDLEAMGSKDGTDRWTYLVLSLSSFGSVPRALKTPLDGPHLEFKIFFFFFFSLGQRVGVVKLHVSDRGGRALQDRVVHIGQELALAGGAGGLEATETGLEPLLLLLELQVGVGKGVEDGRGREGHDEDPT
jgi:hypothetical protein